MNDKLLSDDISQQIQQLFSQLKQPVQVLFFGKKQDCDYCDDTRQLISEVINLSDQLSLSIHDLDEEPALAKQYKVDKAPTLVISGKDGQQLNDYGIRFAGIPSGHEFSSLIHTIMLVSSRDSGLKPETRQRLKELRKPVHLQVFVTPT